MQLNSNKILIKYTIQKWLICLVIVSALAGFRHINSIALILLFATWLLLEEHAKSVSAIVKDRFFVCSILYFFLNFFPVIFTNGVNDGFQQIETKIGFLFIPFILASATPLQEKVRKQIMMIASFSAVILFSFLLFVAVIKYWQTKNTNVFFYHEFVSPLKHHAIYLSAYIGICIIYLAGCLKKERSDRGSVLFLLLVLIMFIVLLSSKNVIVVLAALLIIYLVQYSYSHKKNEKYKLVLIIIVFTGLFASLVLTNNPVSKRFKETFVTDISVVLRDHYSTDMYFSGLQFRLIAWKFSLQIIKDKKKYLLGVGPSRAQPELDAKYRNANMYSGEQPNSKAGYIGYNAHNQFVQTFLQSGILGLLLLLGMIFFLCRKALIEKNDTFLSIIVLTATLFLTESVLEGQYGIVLFLFYPYLFSKDHD